jgi:phenylpropionate dioxygenase-like ring-hydroxylating dioxygenase large terminal subunit
MKTTDLSAEPSYLPSTVFTDAARFERERQEIFRTMPMLAALTADIPNPGDMRTFDALGPSILLVRTRTGAVNAFLNMCVHRAARLVDKCESRTRIVCPFHAWTYDLDGGLIAVPRREAFDEADLHRRRLIRVPVGEWAGLIFVKATAGDDQIDVQEFLGDFAPLIESLNLREVSTIKLDRLNYQCNWKYAVDTSNELYHVGVLHAKTFGPAFVGDSTVIKQYGLHHSQILAQRRETGAMDESPAVDYANVYSIFPNVTIAYREVRGGKAFVNILRQFPGSHVGEGVALNLFARCGAPTDDDRFAYELTLETLMEDLRVCESVQRNLVEAPAEFFVAFGRNEYAAPAAHRNIAKIIGMPI